MLNRSLVIRGGTLIDGTGNRPVPNSISAINHPIEENRITLEEAVKCYTLNGAFASFEEDIKGSIEPGKLADITILSDDLSLIPLEDIKNLTAEMTIVNGCIQWQMYSEHGRD